MAERWDRTCPGAYRRQCGLALGIIERSERGFWWWMVCDGKTGIPRGANRALRLKDAKKEADELINKVKLQLVRGTFG